MVRQGSPMWPRAEGLRAFSFGDPGTMRRRLTALALAGTKVATAGLLKQDYFDKDEAIEEVGERQALLGDDGQIAAVIEITRVEIPRLPRRAVGVCGRGRRGLHFSRALARRAPVVLRQTRHRSRETQHASCASGSISLTHGRRPDPHRPRHASTERDPSSRIVLVQRVSCPRTRPTST